MLKTMTALSVLAILLAAPAGAEARFEGVLKFTKKSADCNSTVKLNEEWRSHYRPGNVLSDNGNEWSGLNIVKDFEATGWGTHADLTLNFQKSYSGTLREKFVGRTSEDSITGSTVLIRLLALPPALSSSTQTLVLRGQIKNPFNTSNQKTCKVDFLGNYYNRQFAPPP
jgi:hypothetical protein